MGFDKEVSHSWSLDGMGSFEKINECLRVGCRKKNIEIYGLFNRSKRLLSVEGADPIKYFHVSFHVVLEWVECPFWRVGGWMA